MAASYPKPDGDAVTRHKQQFSWVDLPATGRRGNPPALPKRVAGSKAWSAQTKAAWRAMWKKPQATQWDQDGSSMHMWAMLHEDMIQAQKKEKSIPASVAGEMRQIEDRHGLTPKAMLQLRWRVADPVVAQKAKPKVSDDRKVVAMKRRA